MQHQNTFPITDPSQRYYSPLYPRQQIDIFYDLAQLAHTIIFNETHLHPNQQQPLFIDPQVVASTLDIKIRDQIRPYVYVYRIQYRLDQDEDYIPSVLNIVLEGDRPTNVCETFKDSIWLRFSVSYKWQTFIYDQQKTIDLFRIWLLIPRAYNGPYNIEFKYERLLNEYNAKQNIQNSIFPEFVLASNATVNQEISGLIKDKEDILRLIRDFALR